MTARPTTRGTGLVATADSKANPLVVLQDVEVAIAGRTILRGLHWSLEAGTHWGVVGANGSGKSTLLGLVAGTHWPAPGRGRRIYNFGAGNLGDAVEAKRRITLVGHALQDRYARFGWNFTAADVVLSGIFRTDVPRHRATDAERDTALGVLDGLGLGPLARRRFLELSRGEQRRVLIARAMAFEPAILLLDEPAAGLDRDARRRLDALVEDVAAKTTVVASAHTHERIPATMRRFIELEAGRIVRSAPRPATAAAPSMPSESQGEPWSESQSKSQRKSQRESRSAPSPLLDGEPLIDIENADVWLGGRRVLASLHWRLNRGEHWLVTGDNGTGKSTFLRLLHGQLRPALGGTIRWPALGNPRSVWRLRRRIGYVSAELQAAYRYPTRVREALVSGFDSSIGLTRPPSTAESERVEELIERFELGPLADRYLSTLSYGQLHRVLIARTLVTKPLVLLLDEPWEGLDAATSALLEAQLAQALGEGTQVVCVSHTGGHGMPFTNELALGAGTLMHDGDAAAPRESSSSAP